MPEVWASHFGIEPDEVESKLDRTPERMATPIVPHPLSLPRMCSSGELQVRDEMELCTDLGHTECTPSLLNFEGKLVRFWFSTEGRSGAHE